VTKIVIELESGQDGQPVGKLQATGPPLPFAGWLELVRLLEEQLRLGGGPGGQATAAGGS